MTTFLIFFFSRYLTKPSRFFMLIQICINFLLKFYSVILHIFIFVLFYNLLLLFFSTDNILLCQDNFFNSISITKIPFFLKNSDLNTLETKTILYLGIQSLLFNSYQTTNTLTFFGTDSCNNLYYFTDSILILDDVLFFLRELSSTSKLICPNFIDEVVLDNFGAQNYFFFLIENFNEDNLDMYTNFQTTTDILSMVDFQLNFLNGLKIFFSQKFLIFFNFNLILIFFMIFSLFNLCKSPNLIYSLISFLIFAVSGGLLTILWGAEYIGLCIILIYGAAIPVLALYIIMLVNVDLIQRLFFVESSKFFSNFIGLKFFILSIFLTYLSYLVCNTSLNDSFANKNYFLQLLEEHHFYYLMANHFKEVKEISYSLDSVFDLAIFSFNSDIDKVASAAFWLSYNELIALVILLLIAIIVVISISRVWTEFELSSELAQVLPFNINLDIIHYLNDWSFHLLKKFNMEKFLLIFNLSELWNFNNSKDIKAFKVSDFVPKMGYELEFERKHKFLKYFTDAEYFYKHIDCPTEWVIDFDADYKEGMVSDLDHYAYHNFYNNIDKKKYYDIFDFLYSYYFNHTEFSDIMEYISTKIITPDDFIYDISNNCWISMDYIPNLSEENYFKICKTKPVKYFGPGSGTYSAQLKANLKAYEEKFYIFNNFSKKKS